MSTVLITLRNAMLIRRWLICKEERKPSLKLRSCRARLLPAQARLAKPGGKPTPNERPPVATKQMAELPNLGPSTKVELVWQRLLAAADFHADEQ